MMDNDQKFQVCRTVIQQLKCMARSHIGGSLASFLFFLISTRINPTGTCNQAFKTLTSAVQHLHLLALLVVGSERQFENILLPSNHFTHDPRYNKQQPIQSVTFPASRKRSLCPSASGDIHFVVMHWQVLLVFDMTAPEIGIWTSWLESPHTSSLQLAQLATADDYPVIACASCPAEPVSATQMQDRIIPLSAYQLLF